LTLLNAKPVQEVGPPDCVDRPGVTGQSQSNLSDLGTQSEIVIDRWTDKRVHARREALVAPAGGGMLGIALAPTRVRLLNGADMIFDGVMSSGMSYVCWPSQTLQAEFAGPADFLRLSVAGSLLQKQPLMPGTRRVLGDTAFASITPRDALIDLLARTLHTTDEVRDRGYIETLARAIVVRVTHICESNANVSALPKWRLTRVVDYIELHMSGPITVEALATAAGLSRAHFTAQFRVATGCRPHDFILLRRVEAAKRLLLGTTGELISIALAVGFQTQAHFSDVFKRLVGQSPGRWRRARLAESTKGENLSERNLDVNPVSGL
jgi:AraC family transcriptional regulator